MKKKPDSVSCCAIGCWKTRADAESKPIPVPNNSYFEVYAGSALQQSRAELSAFFTHVEADQREEWSEYATAHLKEWAHPGHMYKYGSLDRLNETGYIADMRKKTSEGFVPDDEWDEYWPMVSQRVGVSCDLYQLRREYVTRLTPFCLIFA